MEDILKSLDEKKRLLLHVCCAPCATYPFSCLKKHFDINLYFVNDNIDTNLEFNKRLKEIERYLNLKKENIEIAVKEYDHDLFLDSIKGFEEEVEGGRRCKICIKNRLEESFKYAKENNFDCVTTTLTISPHKDSNYINELGKALSEKYELSYLYSDFKKKEGYKKSIEISKEFGLYRQDYCGCEFGGKNEN